MTEGILVVRTGPVCSPGLAPTNKFQKLARRARKCLPDPHPGPGTRPTLAGPPDPLQTPRGARCAQPPPVHPRMRACGGSIFSDAEFLHFFCTFFALFLHFFCRILHFCSQTADFHAFFLHVFFPVFFPEQRCGATNRAADYGTPFGTPKKNRASGGKKKKSKKKKKGPDLGCHGAMVGHHRAADTERPCAALFLQLVPPLSWLRKLVPTEARARSAPAVVSATTENSLANRCAGAVTPW